MKEIKEFIINKINQEIKEALKSEENKKRITNSIDPIRETSIIIRNEFKKSGILVKDDGFYEQLRDALDITSLSYPNNSEQTELRHIIDGIKNTSTQRQQYNQANGSIIKPDQQIDDLINHIDCSEILNTIIQTLQDKKTQTQTQTQTRKVSF